MKLQYCLTGILLLSLKVCSQTPPLSIDDKMPAVKINSILNHPVSSTSFSAFNNKLVILDFMTTTCTGCLKALPKMDALQKKYKGSMQVIIVTPEPAEKIKKFLLKHSYDLPVVVRDTVLSGLFPHTFIPHEVWIHKGKVKAITNSGKVTAENIEAMLSDKKINWTVKNDLPPYDHSKPLLADTAARYYSLFTSYKEGASAKNISVTDSLRNNQRITMFNLSVLSLYFRSYGRKVFPESFIIFETDPSSFIYTKNDPQWRKKHTYCYEQLYPLDQTESQAGERMRRDLDHFFSLNGRFEKRTITCNIIVKDTVAITGRSPANTTVNNLVAQLNTRYRETPFINESGSDADVYIDALASSLTDPSALLRGQGFTIIPAQREVEVFVLRANKSINH